MDIEKHGFVLVFFDERYLKNVIHVMYDLFGVNDDNVCLKNK
jgi:hypothetical protein